MLRADHDVAELARANGQRVVAVDREREHVGRLVDRAMAPVELPDARLADELDRDMAVEHPGAGEREGSELLDLERRERDRADDVDLDAQPVRACLAVAISGAERTECSS